MSKQITITISEDDLNLLLRSSRSYDTDITILAAQAERKGIKSLLRGTKTMRAELRDLINRLESLR
jgi:hypothetical protein